MIEINIVINKNLVFFEELNKKKYIKKGINKNLKKTIDSPRAT